MFKQVQLCLNFEANFRPQQNIAYNLYAALCEKLPEEISDYLHHQTISPISSYIKYSNNLVYWIISLFGEIGNEILPTLNNLQELTLTKINKTIKLSDFQIINEFSESEFCKKYLVSEKIKREFNCCFVTPCSFRSSNEYVNIPSKSLIIKSIAQRWDRFATEFKLSDEESLEQIINHCRITRYNLSSAVYQLKGVNVSSFTGNLILTVHGPEPLTRIVNLMIAFSQYSGIGIKTALGMGGINII